MPRLFLLPGEQESWAALPGGYSCALAGPAAAPQTPALPGQELSQPGFPELLHSQTRQGPTAAAKTDGLVYTEN